jgi:hypothetical protein
MCLCAGNDVQMHCKTKCLSKRKYCNIVVPTYCYTWKEFMCKIHCKTECLSFKAHGKCCPDDSCHCRCCGDDPMCYPT